jgi:hypothetical protein
MDVGEWVVSGSDLFISEVRSTEVLMSLDVTTVVIINYEKNTQRYKIENERTREEKLLDRSKAPQNITILYLGLRINIL